MEVNVINKKTTKYVVMFVALASLLILTGSWANVVSADSHVILETDFEDGTTQGWGPRGDVTLEAVTEDAQSGSYSLKTTGRTANWNGPSINVMGMLQPGGVYEVSGYVKLAQGQPASQLIMSMQRTPVGGDTAYDWIAPSAEDGVTDAEWVFLQGEYTFAEEVSGLDIYVESPNETVEFYLDNFTITEVSPPPSTTIVETDFEDGTTQGWGPRGSVTVEAVTEDAQSGTYSLKTTGRTANWNGPSLNVLGLMQPGAVYEISGYVKLVSGQPASQLIISMQRTPEGGDTSYDWIAPSEADGVTDAEWVLLQGQYTFDSEVSGLDIYVESPNETVEFYLDSFTITEVSPPPGETIIETDFEDGTTQGWAPRGEVTLEVVDAVAQSGSNSLKVSGRTENWNGTQYDVLGLLEPGTTYDISGYVKLVEGQELQDQGRIIISMQSTPEGGDTSYDWVAPSAQDGVTDAEWVHLQSQYVFAGEMSELILYIESTDPDVEFYLDNFTVTSQSLPPIQTDIPSVYEELSDYFLVGAAVEPNQLDSPRHADLLAMHFNSLTAENAMKPGSIQPEEGVFNWDGADRLVQFAQDNDMAVHGHTTVWHEQAAEWMFLDPDGNPMEPTPENKALLLERMETHIRAIVSRYKDDINVWDVVNEVIDAAQPDCMRRSVWYEITGMDFIKTAFNVVYEEAPDAVLLINDYGTTNPQKRQCIYDLVSDLLDEGIPVSGIGMQQHNNVQNPSPAAIEETIEMFASLGVEVHITELDVSIYTSNSDAYATEADVPENLLIAQGHRYKDLFDVFKRQADSIGSVTFWGIADDHTWLTNRPITRVDLPLLFDQQLQAKYAYWGIVDPGVLPVPINELQIPEVKPFVPPMSHLKSFVPPIPLFYWEMLPWVQIEGSDTISATFQTRWDEEYLHLFIDVNDPTRDFDDAVDVFIDQNNGKTPEYEEDDRHYTFKIGSHPPRDEVRLYYWPKRDGYQIQAAFALDELAEVDREIGFDVRVTNGSQPDVPISWNDITHSQDSDTSTYGTLSLMEAIKWSVAARAVRPPEIDGVEDWMWRRAAEVNTDVLVEGSEGATAVVKTLWDDEYLYIFAVVDDVLLSKESSNPWEQDSIEIFIDQNNGKTTSYESDDGQYRINFDNELSFGGTGASEEKITSATQIIDGGYIVEAAIQLDAIEQRLGTILGFDIQVNDDDVGDGTRSGVVTWNDPTGQDYQNTFRFGILKLGYRVPRCGWGLSQVNSWCSN
jgi:endo-1,4-beta-xylanase